MKMKQDILKGKDDSPRCCGSGLPEGSAPHQQLVTDGEGVAKWEDKLAYEVANETVLIDSAEITADNYMHVCDITAQKYPPANEAVYEVLKSAVYAGTAVRVVYDGVNYDFPNGFEVTGITEGIPDATLGNPGVHRNSEGNLTHPEQDNGVPFYIQFAYFLTAWYCEDKEPHTVSIYHYPTAIKPLSDTFLPTTVPVIQSAAVGQTVVVKAVDENGRPTEWEASDMNVLTSPNGTKYNLSVSDDGTLSATAAT